MPCLLLVAIQDNGRVVEVHLLPVVLHAVMDNGRVVEAHLLLVVLLAVMDNGRVVEAGAPEELEATSSLYAALHANSEL